MTSMKGILTVAALVGVGAMAAIYAQGARQQPAASQVALATGAVTVYKTPT